MATILLTGFEPFGDSAANPSQDAVLDVHRHWSGRERLVVEILPVEFDAAAARITALLAEHEPDLVIATGLAAGRRGVTPERFAINVQDARIPDNIGHQPVDLPCVPGGPLAWHSSLPVKAIARDLDRAGVPSSVSLSAGTFVCNHVAATLAALTEGSATRGGFIHLPWSDETAPEPTAHDVTAPDAAPFSLPRTALRLAIEIALASCRRHSADIHQPGGTIA